MSAIASRGSEWARPWLVEPARFRLLSWLLPAALAVAVAAAPLPTAVLLAGALLAFALSRSRLAAALALIALMGNVKINYWTGAVTLFPEYVVLAIAAILWVFGWGAGTRRLEERNLMLLFAAFFLAGCLSFVNAVRIPAVFSKASAIPVTALVFQCIVVGIDSRPHLERALRWLGWSALVVALYGILQMVSLVTGWNVGLGAFERFGNPFFYYGVGAPVVWNFTRTFRANSFFNDANILGGYLAAVMCVLLALVLHHGRAGKTRRALLESALLLVTALALLLSLSRSGMLALLIGSATVLALIPGALRGRHLWLLVGAGVLVVSLAAAQIGTDPLLLLTRLSTSFDEADLSSRVHSAALRHALSLVVRYPVTGVGFSNFGDYFGPEVDAHFPMMMAHNAPLSFFAESGLLGGGLFLALVLAIARRPWRALRDPALRARDPGLHAITAGLFGALVALWFSNLFYDYFFRTFVWVFAGLAVSAARLWERRRDETRPA